MLTLVSVLESFLMAGVAEREETIVLRRKTSNRIPDGGFLVCVQLARNKSVAVMCSMLRIYKASDENLGIQVFSLECQKSIKIANGNKSMCQ